MSLMVFSAFLSIVVASIYRGNVILIKDFFIIPQIIKYSFIVYIISQTKINSNTANFYLFSFIAALGVISFLGIMQYYNIFNINEHLFKYYINKENALKNLVNTLPWRRASGTTGNPNHYGFMLSALLPFV